MSNLHKIFNDTFLNAENKNNLINFQHKMNTLHLNLELNLKKFIDKKRHFFDNNVKNL